MKMLIPRVLTMCLVASATMAQTHLDVKVPDSIEHDLIGHVKHITETEEDEMMFGKHEKSTSVDERTYDEHGNRLVREERDGMSHVISRTEYLYDDNGCFVKEIEQDNKKNEHTEFAISFDVRTRVIKKENVKTHELKATLYTPKGYEDAIKYLDANGEVTKTVEVKRLPNNKDSEYAYYDGHHNPTSTIRIDWNRDRTQRRMKIVNHEKGYEAITEYTYRKKDSKGNWLERLEETTLMEDGKKRPLSRKTVSREIEYF